MGEQRALGESMAYYVGAHAAPQKNDYSLFAENVTRMHSFHADNLKYIQLDALCYNKCKLDFTQKAALVAKSMNGEKNA
jgi:hypothetical protein